MVGEYRMTRRAFLVGAERSGTTLLRLMLSHHPNLTWLSEFEYVVDYFKEDGMFPTTEEFNHSVRLDRLYVGHQSKYGIRSLEEGAYPHVADDLLEQIRQTTGCEVIGATIHRHFDRLLRIWPDALIVRIVRDGRDVARSRIGMGWAGNVWTAAGVWVREEALWDSIEPLLDEGQVITVRYEDLVADPQLVLGQICRFLGVDYSEKMLSYPATSTYGPPDGSLAFQWRNSLTSKEISLVESVQREMLERRGYLLSGLATTEPDQLQQIMLRIQCKLYRARFRYRRRGWRLFWAESISKRIGFSSWRDAVRERVNENTNLFLK